MPLIEGPRSALQVIERGEGPPLILLHGLFVGSSAQWFFTSAPALWDHYRTVMIDLPSHGKSPRRPSGYDLESLVDDVRCVVDALDLQSPSFAGHSYGGLISLAYAGRYPVERLALVDVPLPGHELDESLSSPEALMAAIPGPVREALDNGGRRARRLLSSVHYLANESSLLDDMENQGPVPMDIDVPTLLVYGETSGCLDCRTTLESEMPQVVRSITLPGGHFLPAECPEALTTALVEFFVG